MKSLIGIASSLLLCSCADMYVTKTDVSTPGGRTAAAIDAKDFYGSKGVHMITNCGVGAANPRAIYIRPFCIATAIFKGDQAVREARLRPFLSWRFRGRWDGGGPACSDHRCRSRHGRLRIRHGRWQPVSGQTRNGARERPGSGDSLRPRQRGRAYLPDLERESVSLRRTRQ